MFISAKPSRMTSYQNSDGRNLLIFKCEPLDEFGSLEIGRNHVFASKKNLGLLSKRHCLELTIRIQRQSILNSSAVVTLGLSSDKVGELIFYPPTKRTAVDNATKGSLCADIFVVDQFFNDLMNALLSNKRPESVQLNLDDEGAIKYGWEPDGTRKEWKLEDESETSKVDVAEISITYEFIT